MSFKDLYEKYINNQPLINLVDFETGYKKSE